MNAEKEYELLRAEILQNLNNTHSAITIMYASIGAIFAAIVQMYPSHPLAILFIYIILVPISLRISQLHDSNVRIATYMEVVLEQNAGFHWETNNSLRMRMHNRKTFFSGSVFYSLLMMVNFVSSFIGLIILIVFVCLSKNFNQTIMGLCICVACQIVLLKILHDDFGYEKRRLKYLTEWLAVKHNLESETKQQFHNIA